MNVAATATPWVGQIEWVDGVQVSVIQDVAGGRIRVEMVDTGNPRRHYTEYYGHPLIANLPTGTIERDIYTKAKAFAAGARDQEVSVEGLIEKARKELP